MRSLIFAGGRHPEFNLALPYIQPYSLVVAADSGFDAAISAGIPPDVVVGDMDSISDLDVLNHVPSDKIQRFSQDKDLSDTEIAFNYCISSGSNDIVLIGGGGGRMDHFFALRSLFDRSLCPSVWVGETTLLIKVEKVTLEIKGLRTEDCISVFSAGKTPHTCLSEGFVWPLDALAWDKGEYSLSNKTQNSFVKFTAQSGRFLVVVPLRQGLSFNYF